METVDLILNRNAYFPEKGKTEETEGTETIQTRRKCELGRSEWARSLIFVRTSYCSCQIPGKCFYSGLGIKGKNN